MPPASMPSSSPLLPSSLLHTPPRPQHPRERTSPAPVPSPQSPVPPPPSSSPTLRLPLRSKNLALRYPTSKSQSVRTLLQITRPSRKILQDYFVPRIPIPNPPHPASNDKFVRTGEDSTREYRGPHSFGPSQSRWPSSNGQPGEMSTKPRPGGPTGGLVDKGSKEPSLAVVPKQVSREVACDSS
jgi:hypothetical protein